MTHFFSAIHNSIVLDPHVDLVVDLDIVPFGENRVVTWVAVLTNLSVHLISQVVGPSK